jgi:hypothetical protein
MAGLSVTRNPPLPRNLPRQCLAAIAGYLLAALGYSAVVVMATLVSVARAETTAAAAAVSALEWVVRFVSFTMMFTPGIALSMAPFALISLFLFFLVRGYLRGNRLRMSLAAALLAVVPGWLLADRVYHLDMPSLVAAAVAGILFAQPVWRWSDKPGRAMHGQAAG